MARVHRFGTLVVAVTLSAAACPSESPERLPSGSWGGEHIGMIVADTGASIEYDCAVGTIAGPLTLASGGTFAWSGIHYPGHGGPIRVDEPTNAHAARYSGRLDGDDNLQLTVRLSDGSQPKQTFSLRRGGQARVFKCL